MISSDRMLTYTPPAYDFLDFRKRFYTQYPDLSPYLYIIWRSASLSEYIFKYFFQTPFPELCRKDSNAKNYGTAQLKAGRAN